MSGRTIPRFALVGLLAMACAVPIGAQYTSPQYPSPATTPSAKTIPGKLAGTWYRQVEGAVVATTFTDDEMKVCVTCDADGSYLTLTADYTLTKNGLVHGAITGVDWDVKPEPKAATLSLALEALTNDGISFETLVDCPFSFRTRLTSVGLMVSNIKIGVDESIGQAKLLCGMYTLSKDGTVPTPKPAIKTTTYGGITLPSPRYLEHYPQYIAPNPTAPLPREIHDQDNPEGTARGAGTATPTSPPMMPTPVPPNLQSVDTKPISPNISPPVTEPIQQTAWTVRVVAQSSATLLPTAVAKPGIVGTWYREFGSKLYVIKITPDYMTMTAIMSGEVDGKIATVTCVTTADYHISRDGMTIVGLITGVDAQIEGDVAEDDVKELGKEIEQDRKIKEDQPFALMFRMYGDSLVIRNVRMPGERDGHEDNPLQTTSGGTYKNAGDKPLPKPKVVKMSPPALDLSILPAPPTNQNNTTLPGSPPVPNSFDSTPRMVEPTAPVPTMPTPTLPASEIPSSTNNSEKKVPAKEIAIAWQNQIEYLPDPTRNGKFGANLFGKLFLYGPAKQLADVEGTLTVDLVDETPRPMGLTSSPLERWVFTRETLSKLARSDERFGKYYALFLPWPTYSQDVTQVRITVRFEPVNGLSLNAPVTTLKPIIVPKGCIIDEEPGVGLTPASPVKSPKSDTKEMKKQPGLFFAPKSKLTPESSPSLHPLRYQRAYRTRAFPER